jgi:hypothetical protein
MANNNPEDEEEDHIASENEEEDEMTIQPYLNRSLAWTLRYRKLNPYDKVRRRVLNFGHRSKGDWDECIANGWQGQYVPTRPDLMYAPEWEGWDEFLGLMRSYQDCRRIAVYTLGLTNFDDYILFVR